MNRKTFLKELWCGKNSNNRNTFEKTSGNIMQSRKKNQMSYVVHCENRKTFAMSSGELMKTRTLTKYVLV